MGNLRERAKRNGFLRKAVHAWRYVVKYFIPNLFFQAGVRCRNRNAAVPRFYQTLRQYKNKHKGERCFIVATGPSLTVEDLKLIENEVSFGMNSLCRIAQKSEWLPTYYGIQDTFVFKSMREDVLAFIDQVPSFITSDIYRSRGVRAHRPIVFPLNRKDHWINAEDRNIAFSQDAFLQVYDGYTITYSLIQLAVYMGFTEIYLLGADSDYSQESKKHFIEHGVQSPTESTAFERLTRSYTACRRALEHSGKAVVYNATRGGKLEVFERKSLDDVLAQPRARQTQN